MPAISIPMNWRERGHFWKNVVCGAWITRVFCVTTKSVDQNLSRLVGMEQHIIVGWDKIWFSNIFSKGRWYLEYSPCRVLSVIKSRRNRRPAADEVGMSSIRWSVFYQGQPALTNGLFFTFLKQAPSLWQKMSSNVIVISCIYIYPYTTNIIE